MFFDLSKNRLALIAGVLAIIFGALFATVYLNKTFGLGEDGKIYLKQARESTSYYWSYKFPGNLLSFFGSSFSADKGAGSGAAKSIPVLAYHGLTSEGGKNTFSKDKFIDQMNVLYKAGWRT